MEEKSGEEKQRLLDLSPEVVKQLLVDDKACEQLSEKISTSLRERGNGGLGNVWEVASQIATEMASAVPLDIAINRIMVPALIPLAFTGDFNAVHNMLAQWQEQDTIYYDSTVLKKLLAAMAGFVGKIDAKELTERRFLSDLNNIISLLQPYIPESNDLQDVLMRRESDLLVQLNSVDHEELLKQIDIVIPLAPIFPKLADKIINRVQALLPNSDIASIAVIHQLANRLSLPQAALNLISLALSNYSAAVHYIGLNTGRFSSKRDEQKEKYIRLALKVILERGCTLEDFILEETGLRRQRYAKNDPYKQHPNRFTPKHNRLAIQIARIMRNPAMRGLAVGDEEIELNEDSRNVLSEINKHVNSAYEAFLISAEQVMSSEELSALKGEGKVRMAPLLRTCQWLIARLLAQLAGGDLQSLPSSLTAARELVEPIITEAFNRYLRVYQTDIPLYDKLYTMFDTLHKSEDTLLEVYLGRDGIYAYVGRKAQNAARASSNKTLAIFPKYLVYPRGFVRDLDDKTKQEFLAHAGITQESNPHFFDTGFRGTIPEDIMQVMQFDGGQIDRRIHLLSSDIENRRIPEVPEVAIDSLVGNIEYNAKLEMTATGLIKEDDNIRHIAEPTPPEEQFLFLMILQAIIRHYWIHERKRMTGKE